MTCKILSTLLILFAVATESHSQVHEMQKIGKYAFSDYRTEVYNGPISRIKQKGASEELTEAYKKGKVNFAGHYIMSFSFCGTGCMSGEMVDVRTGKIYDFPSGMNSEFDGVSGSCDRIGYATSRLFVFTNCESKMGSKKGTERVYSIHHPCVWNEKDKKFVELPTFTDTKIIRSQRDF